MNLMEKKIITASSYTLPSPRLLPFNPWTLLSRSIPGSDSISTPLRIDCRSALLCSGEGLVRDLLGTFHYINLHRHTSLHMDVLLNRI